MKDNVPALEKKIGIHFKNKELARNAFVHRSHLNENKNFPLPSNEKLEFLGDSVLSLITSVYLYKKYPSFKEGDYTEIKSAIVNTGSLAKAAQRLDLGRYLYLSRGEESGDGRGNKNILADCFEALIASIFLDKGFNKAYVFVLRYLFKDTLDHIIREKLYLSAKSKLQEYAQGSYKTVPSYKVLEQTGPEHKRIFKVGVYLNGKKLAEAIGMSKKEAEEEAAKKTLYKIKGKGL
ncbi:ribonuclease III [Candidatus Roizmanbacteria bacterium]|nr:ribonuclease III [Candidatus Roizmanbacteria bacterium]